MRIVIYPGGDDTIRTVAKAHKQLQQTVDYLTGTHTVETNWSRAAAEALPRTQAHGATATSAAPVNTRRSGTRAEMSTEHKSPQPGEHLYVGSVPVTVVSVDGTSVLYTVGHVALSRTHQGNLSNTEGERKWWVT